jgi:PREDICTED: similar to CG12024-PB, isoform B
MESGIEREQILMDRGQLPVTSLEFNQAMSDFKTMFPQTDEDVIEMVLRSNHGAVDVTIDQLLSMNIDSEKEKLRSQSETNSQNNDEV